MRRVVAASAASALALISLVVAPSSATTATTPQPGASTGVYVVSLRAQPLATYDGHIEGLAATAPADGQRYHAGTRAARAYSRHLSAGQARILTDLGDPEVLYTYTTALDGFAAVLSTDQVKQLEQVPGVASVDESRLARLDSVNLSRLPGAAASADPTARLHADAQQGHGRVVGVIDSGIWPENPSFAGIPTDRTALRQAYPGFSGSCRRGERWARGLCNAKVIAAQYFVKGFGRDNLAASDFASPRDGSGHGSRTAALAAGNTGVDVTIDGQHFGRIAGAAPGAALSIYKACWTAPEPSGDGCTTADTVKAIDRAVSDGVDVISYSIGGADSATDPVERAFLHAAQAGVFVAASAGDDGPSASTVAHPSPWVTTVAATTHHLFRGAVVLGNGDSRPGSMVSDRRVDSSPLVYGGNVPAVDASSRQAALCLPGALDARVVEGAIVVCERGNTARISKSVSVAQAGGSAMVLLNTVPGPTDADVHAVPTVQVDKSDAAAIRSYIDSTPKPTASLEPSGAVGSSPPGLADFSARGPDAASEGNVLKPDVAALGVGVVSAVSPASDVGRLWDLGSGTSMAAPLVAGLAADVTAAHPGWSPAAVKSALMTTAVPIRSGSGPLADGAGEVDPLAALDPGLVYDTGTTDWRNLASVSVGDLVAQQTVARRVTNVGSRAETYTAQVRGLPGLSVSVDPPSISLAPGQSRTFSLTFIARRAARYERFLGGSLSWTGSRGHRVTSPIVIRPSYVDAPAEVSGAGSTGTATVSARAGVTGTIATTLVGPVAARPVSLSLRPEAFDSRHPASSSATWSRSYNVPAGTAAARFEVSSVVGGDVDLYVYRDGKPVAAASSPSSTEQITMPEPAAGRYQVFVNAAVASASPHRVAATFTGWVLPQGARNPDASAPQRSDVTGGRTFALSLGWSHLDTSRRWFGELGYEHSTAVTYVRVD